jgi:hypothetical protein
MMTGSPGAHRWRNAADSAAWPPGVISTFWAVNAAPVSVANSARSSGTPCAGSLLQVCGRRAALAAAALSRPSGCSVSSRKPLDIEIESTGPGWIICSRSAPRLARLPRTSVCQETSAGAVARRRGAV